MLYLLILCECINKFQLTKKKDVFYYTIIQFLHLLFFYDEITEIKNRKQPFLKSKKIFERQKEANLF